jgi:RNA polymerase sigma-70 factor (ECF subfamily)
VALYTRPSMGTARAAVHHRPMNAARDNNRSAVPLNPERWVDEHADVLYRFALLRVRDPHLAEDLVQDTFIAALEGIDTFRGGSSVRTWLVGILKHKIIDSFRRSNREVASSDLASLTGESDEAAMDRAGERAARRPLAWQTDPHNTLENKEFWKTFVHCLDGLPPAFRRAFTLRELDDLKTDEICKILDVTSTNLWVILHRARAKLRDCLEDSWFRVRS